MPEQVWEVTIVFNGGSTLVLHSRTEPTFKEARLRADWIEHVALLDINDERDGAVAITWQEII